MNVSSHNRGPYGSWPVRLSSIIILALLLFFPVLIVKVILMGLSSIVLRGLRAIIKLINVK